MMIGQSPLYNMPLYGTTSEVSRSILSRGTIHFSHAYGVHMACKYVYCYSPAFGIYRQGHSLRKETGSSLFNLTVAYLVIAWLSMMHRYREPAFIIHVYIIVTHSQSVYYRYFSVVHLSVYWGSRVLCSLREGGV